MLTPEELITIKADLKTTDEYVRKYAEMFMIDKYEGVKLGVLISKYDEILETMNKIHSRKPAIATYNAAQDTPLLVADVHAYLRQVIAFAQCRHDNPDTSPGHRRRVRPNWQHDQRTLIELDQWVKDLILKITPIGVTRP